MSAVSTTVWMVGEWLKNFGKLRSTTFYKIPQIRGDRRTFLWNFPGILSTVTSRKGDFFRKLASSLLRAEM